MFYIRSGAPTPMRERPVLITVRAQSAASSLAAVFLAILVNDAVLIVKAVHRLGDFRCVLRDHVWFVLFARLLHCVRKRI